MEQPFSTSKVTVEYFDPHDVYKLLAPGLIPRLPLRNLHWQSHAGPLRSIETLHVELVDALAVARALHDKTVPPARPPSSSAHPLHHHHHDDGFTAQPLAAAADEAASFPSRPYTAGYAPATIRRHQIPGLRRTPYLKVLLVRCDDNDSYKAGVRAEIRDWVKEHTTAGGGGGGGSSSSKKDGGGRSAAAENHDAFEWLIVHVVVPNTVAATQPRVSGGGGGGGSSSGSKADGSSESIVAPKGGASRWGKGSTTLLEKLRADFNNSASSKLYLDRIAQIRIGINDVPYDLLPRVVPAVPTGYMETEEDAKANWAELVDKIKKLILTSFDLRVTQYEEDIRDKDAMRSLPGWNFCTFFILKEGLARGFESVGLIEDALVGYDELSVGLDTIIQEQAAAGTFEVPGGSLLPFTPDLQKTAQDAMASVGAGTMEFEDEEHVDLQQSTTDQGPVFDDIPISAIKKPYRELILANNVSIFDFRCYIFARQIALLLRQGNAWSTREELVAKLKEQQESVLHGVAPRAPPPKQTDESENLAMLAEICKRTLEFIPAVSQVMRRDVVCALTEQQKPAHSAGDQTPRTKSAHELLVDQVADNTVASFAFSVAQQILAQTLTKSLPIPHASVFPTTTSGGDGDDGAAESKASIPEPRAVMHPPRSSSLRANSAAGRRISTLPSPAFFPGPGSGFKRESITSVPEGPTQQYQKAGMEELAARRAELYTLSRNILEEAGKKRGWSDGWSSAPVIGDSGLLEDVSLDDDDDDDAPSTAQPDDKGSAEQRHTIAGLDNKLLRTALDNKEDFYRLYELLTDKALRHYTVADHTHAVLANMSELAVMKYYLQDYAAAASYFVHTTPFYGESGWSLLELSMLVMYSDCLRELQRNDDYMRVVLKLLSKAANAEKDKLRQKGRLKLGDEAGGEFPGPEAFRGFLPRFLAAAKSFNKEVKHALQNFFVNIELEGPPVYDDGQDSFRVALKLRSVLADALPVDRAMLRIVSAHGARELWLEATEGGVQQLQPGRNRIQLRCNSMSPGAYEVDRIHVHSGPLKLSLERAAFQPPDRHAANLRNPYVVLYQRADTLDVEVEPSPAVQLDSNNAMDVVLATGWNTVATCELRIRSATGGLRLLTSEAQVVGGGAGDQPQPHTPETGLFGFSGLAAASSLRLRIPFTTEQDVASISVRVEAKYTTDGGGTYTLCKTPSISLALKLGVNVQDVFKHSALYSRFTVSTSGCSPLRLFKSELIESDVFESRYGVPPGNPVLIFPKQPSSLLYQIRRKPGSTIGPTTNKTMYLRLSYSVLQDEMAANMRDSLSAAMKGSPLWQYSRLTVAAVLKHVRAGLTAYDLERAAVLGELPTGFLAEVDWQHKFQGLGTAASGEALAGLLTEFLVKWTQNTPTLPAMRTMTGEGEGEEQSILIPVDIPSIPVVHTADIRLQRPAPSSSSSPSLVQAAADSEAAPPVACVNQLMPATLHLKWTRVWDTEQRRLDDDDDDGGGDEFSYEVSAPGDTWLVGGRKKGHFVIPPAASSSTPVNEADIALVLMPLREGWLPFPGVEVVAVGGGGGGGGGGPCETDYRNLGETVRVVADRGRVTVSLDASGPGGGPLVLESERFGVGAGVL